MPCLHHDDNQSCNLRTARIEQDGIFIAASPISRAPSSLTLRFDITSAIDGRGKGPGIGQDTRASHVRRCTTGGVSPRSDATG